MNTDRNIVINSENLSSSITMFDEKIGKVEETLNKISTIMGKIDGNNELWKSDTALSVHEKFSKLENNFEKINAELNVYSIFLKETLDNYKIEEIKQEKAVVQSSENLDIN